MTLVDWELTGSERQVLGTVWRSAPIARNQVTEITGLGSATVTRLTKQLSDRGLIQETTEHSGQRGHPARPMMLRPDGAFAFGVYFSHTYMDVGIIDLDGQLVGVERRKFEYADPKAIAAAAKDGLDRLTEAAGIPLSKVVGAGFALPGDFAEDRTILRAHEYFPALIDHNLVAEFGQLMPVKVFVENDAASAGLGERVNGVGKRLDSFVFIHIGHGVGGSLVLDGRLHRGKHGNAGIIGILYPIGEPRPSGQDLIELLRANGLPVSDFDDLDNLTVENTPLIAQWVERAARQLRSAVRISARMIDPDAIVLGGRLPQHLQRALVAAIDTDEAFMGTAVPNPPLRVSELGPHTGVIGAASVCMFDTFFSGI